MKILNSGDTSLDNSKHSIFLAGPTPRSNGVISWRIEAIEIFKKLGWYGNLIIPEPYLGNKQDQYEWEWKMLEKADLILFWVPRNMETMPALTTNIEFGLFIKSGKIIYGRPDDSERNGYLDALYLKETGFKPNNNLEDLIENSIEFVEILEDIHHKPAY